MRFTVETRDFQTLKTHLLVLNMHDGEVDTHSFLGKLDKKTGGFIKQVLKQEKFEGKAGQTKLINTWKKLSADYVLIVGLGEKKNFNLEIVRKASASAYQTALQIRASKIVTAAHGGHLGVFSKGECVQAVVEGMGLAAYQFSRYKKLPKDSPTVEEVALLCPDPKKVAEVKRGLERGELVAQGARLARDLINTPAADMAPFDLAKMAQGLKGIKTVVYKEPQIRAMKMGAYLGVAQGSIHPPAFIEMHYKPTGSAKKKVVIIGKGVTFDSGGLSLKPPKSMETMKDDMSGAAAVIGLMSVIAQLKPKVEVWGLVAAAENMPDAKSQRPGDVVTASNGKTIEVLNTDAEGRLTLADALVYAQKKNPHYTIDLATLTGACLVALGDRISAIMGNDKKLVDTLISCGLKTGEKLWELPLADEYKNDLKSPIADLKNIGGPYGGTINGGLFLQEFVGSMKWAHLDIAGPSWTDAPREYEKKGGTGVMVRTLAEFLEKL
ncbi:MAG: hypothetical protein A2048_00430 [Deltaproteobacteria bacterium GWA2_45_12]|nr:MAG: hypothetical protein A2048_00430 [Deltaproteobacteria bacterium GWA2_45_12]